MTAPAEGGNRLVVATATVHVNSAADLSSTWTLDTADSADPGTPIGSVDRILSLITPGSVDTTNPSDTITLTTSIVQEPGDSHDFSVSGELNDGGPLANIEVEITVMSSPLDGSGAPPSTTTTTVVT